MVLSSVSDVIEIAKGGMKLQKQIREEDSYDYSNAGYYMTVLYRMKNGQKIYRSITIPYDTYDEQLEKIVSGEEFKKGYFECFSDERVRGMDSETQFHTLRYMTLGDSESITDFSYADFSDAYRKDILENYTFSEIKNKMPIGTIEYENNGSDYVFGSFEVYDSFANTIALLQKYGIYREGVLRAGDVKEIKVTNYYVGYDLDGDDSQEIPSEDTRSSFKVYSDKESIEKIIEVSFPNSYHNPWFNYSHAGFQYGIEIYMKGNTSNYSDLYYTFIKGKVPDFVKTDTES